MALIRRVGAHESPIARDLQRVEHAVARILAETEAPVEVYEAAARGDRQLARLGARRGLGGRARRRPPALRVHLARGRGRARVRGAQRAARRSGRARGSRAGCSSRGEPAWIVDAPADANFPRADAARRSGLHAAFGFPLRSPRGVVGVMEFFSARPARARRAAARDDARARQPGRPVRRAAAGRGGGARERVAAAGDARGGARRGRHDGPPRAASLGWNHAAETTFGYRAHEAIGRDMADLIVPPALRARTARGSRASSRRSTRASSSTAGSSSPACTTTAPSSRSS